jgi:hypothetical protein
VTDKPPKFVRAQSAIAELISQKFGIRCQQSDISHWLKLRGVQGSVPFPAPNARNDYNVAACFKWVEAYIMPNEGKIDKSWRQRAEEADALIKERKAHQLSMRNEKEQGRLIDRSIAERTALVAIKKLLGMYKETDEHRTVEWLDGKLIEVGVTPEQRAAIKTAFVEWQQKITDQREQAAAKAEQEVTE